jgi:hypothetical protein
MLIGKTLTHSVKSTGSTRDEYHLIPIVPAGWQPGEAVHYVLKVTQIADLPGQRPVWPRRAPRPEDKILLGRADGGLAVSAAQQFKKSGVAVSDNAVMLAYIPAVDGKPAIKDTAAQDWNMFLVLCTAISALICLCIGATWLGHWLRQRRAAH